MRERVEIELQMYREQLQELLRNNPNTVENKEEYMRITRNIKRLERWLDEGIV